MIWKKKDNLNTMTRAHVRHSPRFPFSARFLGVEGRWVFCQFLSCLILLFIIALWAPLAKCSLYINNTGSIRSRWMCFCSFFSFVWSHLCIIQFYLWLYNNCYYNYKDNWWACMHLSSVLTSRVYEFVRKRKKKWIHHQNLWPWSWKTEKPASLVDQTVQKDVWLSCVGGSLSSINRIKHVQLKSICFSKDVKYFHYVL